MVGHLEIRNVLAQQKGACKATVIFSLPLGSALAERLTSASGLEVTTVSPRPFRVHSPNRQVFRTMEGNFMPGIIAVGRRCADRAQLADRRTGRLDQHTAFATATQARSKTWRGWAANWRTGYGFWPRFHLRCSFWMLAGVWMSIRFGSEIATAIDDLSSRGAANRTRQLRVEDAVRSRGQLGDLVCKLQ